jgi:flavodoxin
MTQRLLHNPSGFSQAILTWGGIKFCITLGKILLTELPLIKTMNAVVVYFSRTGNTKRLGQAIADAAKAQIFDLTITQPSAIEGFDLLILGTPVEGASPAKETAAFVATMKPAQGKKAILFCTYKMFGNERTMKAIEKELTAKGYETILKVSKKGMSPEKEAAFSEVVSEVKKTLDKL